MDDLQEYVTITVKRRHGGLEPREKLFGHQIKTKKQYRLIPGAFLISRIQCWHQAYAIVPEDIPAKETQALFVKALKSEFEHYSDKTVKIGEVFKVTTGGTPSRGNPAFWGGKVKWVSSGEVAFGPIFDTAEKITDVGVAGSNAKVYPPNTVLIAMIGQGKMRGQCAILFCHAATNQNVAGIHVYATPHNPEYVFWWLFSRYQESRSSEIGTAQPALSSERVKQMPIPLPPPNEQAQIVGRLNVISRNIEALKKSQAETADELDALMPSILAKAFRGEL